MLTHFTKEIGPFTITCDEGRVTVDDNKIRICRTTADKIERKARFLNDKVAGHFHDYLFKAWQRADLENRRSLMRAFPEFSLSAMEAFGWFQKA